MPTLTDDKVWEQFLEWLPSADPSTDPGTLFGQYRSRLMGLGLMDSRSGRIPGHCYQEHANSQRRLAGHVQQHLYEWVSWIQHRTECAADGNR